jgi:hypothetical protein
MARSWSVLLRIKRVELRRLNNRIIRSVPLVRIEPVPVGFGVKSELNNVTIECSIAQPPRLRVICVAR